MTMATVTDRLLERHYSALVERMGSDVTAAQRLLIRLVCVKLVRCDMWQMRSANVELSVDERLWRASWANSARADLTALGLSSYLEREGKMA